MLLLFFKSQSDLFEQTVRVEGHTRKDGAYVKPHTMRVKKKREAPKRQEDMFADDLLSATPKPKPKTVKKPIAPKPENLDMFEAQEPVKAKEEVENVIKFAKNKLGSNSEPKEGDTKTENGITYRLEGGRWRRVDGKRAEIRQLANQDWQVTKYDENGNKVSSVRLDTSGKAELERLEWERGHDFVQHDLHTQESFIDDAATRGYRAGLAGEKELPPFDLEDEHEMAWKIGYRRGIDDRYSQSTTGGAKNDHQKIETHQAPEIVEHITKKGKTIRGVIRKDLTHAQAKAIDEYTFKKDGGWFIREKHLDAMGKLDQARESGVINDEQHATAKEALAKEGPVAAAQALRETVDPAAKRKAQAGKLRKVADALYEKAKAEQGRDRNTNTARRARIAAESLDRARQDEAIAKTMRNLADAIESGDAVHLASVNTRAAVEMLDSMLKQAMYERDRNRLNSYDDQERHKGRAPEHADLDYIKYPSATIHEGNWPGLVTALEAKRGGKAIINDLRNNGKELTNDLHKRIVNLLGKKETDYRVGWYPIARLKTISRLKRVGINTQEELRQALGEYVKFREGKKAEDPVAAAERALVGQKVGIDFFPTPKPLAARMADLAGIKPGIRVLEPSAGNGHLADAARAAGASVDTIEISDTLRKVLEAKKHTIVAHDFESFQPSEKYDAIIMNPPFSKNQDAEHIQRAYNMLKPGGRLVAIAGEGVFFRQDKAATHFRDWLEKNGAEVEKLPAWTFLDKNLPATTSVNARLIVLEKPGLAESNVVANDGPHEGDIKVENGIEYVLRDGRWHRITEEDKSDKNPAQADMGTDDLNGRTDHEPEPTGHGSDSRDGGALGGQREPEVAQDAGETESAEAQHDPVEHAENKADLAEELMRNPNSDKAKELLQKVAEGERRAQNQSKTKQQVSTLETGGDFTDDDPNSPNYRFRDTGYIGGSRKELALQMIRNAAKDGQRLRATDIDWNEIEQNPRQAAELITKSNLFGKVDWDALKKGGMEPGAGFLIDRVYASIAPEPVEDNAQARRDYAIGLESLRDRMEKCKTAEDVTTLLNEIRDEFEGVVLNAEEAEAYKKAQALYSQFNNLHFTLRKERGSLVSELNAINHEINVLTYEQEKRTRRGWKKDAEIDKQIAELQKQVGPAEQAVKEWDEAHPEYQNKWVNVQTPNGIESRNVSPIVAAMHKARAMMDDIEQKAKIRNKIENPLHRAWILMGKRFINVLNYRSYKGSDAFAEHVARAKTGKIKDWSWAEKERTAAPKVTKKTVKFHLKVADKFERKGGRPVKADSTAALKAHFGLRDVQSGNWVLKDPDSAAFHVQRAAEAFADLADLIGVNENLVSMNGRLAMAFGARGKGAAGWAEAAPRAHYEPVHRVINLTKMGGGGSLAHEWFHAVDNLIKEAETGDAGKTDDFVTEDPNLLPDGELKDAVIGLRRAMLDGSKRIGEKIKYEGKDVRTAKYNIDSTYPNTVARSIKAAGDMHAAVRAVDAFFAGRTDKRSEKNRKTWRKLAVAYYDANEAGNTALVESGPALSAFGFEAWKLDGGDHGKYWSSIKEMSARAFQAWCEDRLRDRGQKNDYLSVYADNQYYRDPILGDQKPFPEGDERERINAAFDRLFEVIRKRQVMEKALRMFERVA